MAVDPDITRAYMRDELALVHDLARSQRWGIIPDYDRLTVLVTMFAHNGDPYLIEARCDDYKEIPPLFEFIDPDSGAKGTPHAYPKTNGDSFFHSSGPCICAPFNRKAYKSVATTGPHDNWRLGDWMTCTDSGVQWGDYSKLGDMLGQIHRRIIRPDLYVGRMA